MHSLAEILFDKLNHEVGKAYELSATKCTKRAAELQNVRKELLKNMDTTLV